jgi:hypothetical protein
VSKIALLTVIGSAALVVVALAVLTPMVIVDENDGRDVRVMRVAAEPGGPGGGPAPFRSLRGCLERHGLGRPGHGTPPNRRKLRGTLKDCARPLTIPFPR